MFILPAYPRARIYHFDEAGVAEVAYEDTEHYAVTRDFLTNYPRRLEQLFAVDDEPQPDRGGRSGARSWSPCVS